MHEALSLNVRGVAIGNIRDIVPGNMSNSSSIQLLNVPAKENAFLNIGVNAPVSNTDYVEH